MDRQVWKEFYDEAAKELRSDRLDDEFRNLWHGAPEETATPTARLVYVEFGEAPNDDPEELRSFARALRRGQPAFRRNLLAAYDGKCCVSGWGPESVLEAAHIEEHSKSGLNSLSNGLLLRSDLHALFDEGLLRIDPDRLTVALASSLEGTPYWELQGRPLRGPVRGEGPSRELLSARWQRGGSM
jgi:glycine/D-amino acid oxidase-like deaminating enzyme